MPPERAVNSFSYSTLAATCFSSSESGFAGSASSLCRISSCLALSKARERSTSRGSGPLVRCGELEPSRRRTAGASRRGEGDRDTGDRLRVKGSGDGSPGSGDGSRTADCTADAMTLESLVPQSPPDTEVFDAGVAGAAMCIQKLQRQANFTTVLRRTDHL